jgi:hypothetical protein
VQKNRRPFLALVAACALLGVLACGGSSGGGTDTGATDPGTGTDGTIVTPDAIDDAPQADGTTQDPGTTENVTSDPGTPETIEETTGDAPAPVDYGTTEIVLPDTQQPDNGPDVPPTVCGNGTCDGNEDCLGCPDDCGECEPFCGDGACDTDADETCATCAKDCGGCPITCGDGKCDIDELETCLGCPEDCGVCPPVCGDGTCETGVESCQSCESDCGACSSCGNGTCDDGEDCNSCAGDCGACPTTCGDGWCSWEESCNTCLQDCGPCEPKCGDSFCSWGEDCVTCPADCSNYCYVAECGNRVCEPGEAEDCTSCTADCGICADNCGDGTCADGEFCDNCPADCGKCPPTVYLAINGMSVRLSDAPVAGGPVRVFWDPRRAYCQQFEGISAVWGAKLYATFDLTVDAETYPAVRHYDTGSSRYSAGVYNTLAAPEGATDLFFWVQVAGAFGCSTWDSNGGANFDVPVFEPSAVAEDIAAVAGPSFVIDRIAGKEDLGDRDPAWTFASMAKEGTAPWIQFEVEAPGITDRAYQSQQVASEVALHAIEARVITDAYKGTGGPGSEKKSFPVDFFGASEDGKRFVYRWFAGPLVWKEPIPDGAYTYRLEVRTANGTKTEVVGGGDRTIVLSQAQDCSLFPSNPPADCNK